MCRTGGAWQSPGSLRASVSVSAVGAVGVMSTSLLKRLRDEFGLPAVDKRLEPWVASEIVKLDPGTEFCLRKSFLGRSLQPVERRCPVAALVVADGAEQQVVRIA